MIYYFDDTLQITDEAVIVNGTRYGVTEIDDVGFAPHTPEALVEARARLSLISRAMGALGMLFLFLALMSRNPDLRGAAFSLMIPAAIGVIVLAGKSLLYSAQIRELADSERITVTISDNLGRTKILVTTDRNTGKRIYDTLREVLASQVESTR